MRYIGGRRRRVALQPFLLLCVLATGLGLLMLSLRQLDSPIAVAFPIGLKLDGSNNASSLESVVASRVVRRTKQKSCLTVEEMGKDFSTGVGKESLRVRRIIENHFVINGASRVGNLPPDQFCSHGFVLGKTAEAGFGNEMYKVLTAAALSVMLNRSLIIGQTRHIGSFSSLS